MNKWCFILIYLATFCSGCKKFSCKKSGAEENNQRECLAWAEKEKAKWAEIKALAASLPPCPCNIAQAHKEPKCARLKGVESNFTVDPKCDEKRTDSCKYHPGAVHCLRSARPIQGAGQQCCYNKSGMLMVNNPDWIPPQGKSEEDLPVGGGTLDVKHYKSFFFVASHILVDVFPYNWCCRFSCNMSYCRHYLRYRPSDDCKKYQDLCYTAPAYTTPVYTTPVYTTPVNDKPPMISLKQWGGVTPTYVRKMNEKWPIICVHHTASARCKTKEKCADYIKGLQKDHMSKKWTNVAYNFLIGGDGNVYEGRGWKIMGGHTNNGTFNDISLGFSLIGTFTKEPPSELQISTLKSLINQAVTEGYVTEDYTIAGHRDVDASNECPGQALYDIITKWKRYNPAPLLLHENKKSITKL